MLFHSCLSMELWMLRIYNFIDVADAQSIIRCTLIIDEGRFVFIWIHILDWLFYLRKKSMFCSYLREIMFLAGINLESVDVSGVRSKNSLVFTSFTNAIRTKIISWRKGSMEMGKIWKNILNETFICFIVKSTFSEWWIKIAGISWNFINSDAIGFEISS